MELTREKVLSMEAGRDMDALVAEKVFGLQVRWEQDDITDPYPVDERDMIIDTFSEDILAAWEVVEKFKTIVVKRYVTDKELWFCEINIRGNWHRSYANTAPFAICRAALLTTLKDTE